MCPQLLTTYSRESRPIEPEREIAREITGLSREVAERCKATCAAFDLPLAAQRGVGHIRLNGDVAEWLKAAVC